ncbi:helix-turn-helix transcriptional regulator [Sphingomonas sp. PB4P5]|uniref:helix-turn-helix transcriptional regulator n=1 Tax=Parasphingomonas puruogangriensis TaxID=3096155 RepID=UPI002FC944D3
MQLDYAVPSGDLTDYITVFYLFAVDTPLFEDHERADHAQFRFRLTPGGQTYRFIDGTEQSPPDIHIIGPTSGPIHVRAPGPARLFGMGVTPAGWGAMIGSEASSVLNRTLDATLLFGAARLRIAAAALASAPDIAACVAIAEPLIRELVQHGDASTCGFVQQVDGWLSASTSPDIEDLVVQTGLSRRQVERKCNALYGAPPKLLARKYRALRAAVALHMSDENLDDVIGRGFYDQSHLIREVKQFTGLTPRQIRADPGALQQLTFAQRVALDGQVSPMVSGT